MGKFLNWLKTNAEISVEGEYTEFNGLLVKWVCMTRPVNGRKNVKKRVKTRTLAVTQAYLGLAFFLTA